MYRQEPVLSIELFKLNGIQGAGYGSVSDLPVEGVKGPGVPAYEQTGQITEAMVKKCPAIKPFVIQPT